MGRGEAEGLVRGVWMVQSYLFSLQQTNETIGSYILGKNSGLNWKPWGILPPL